MTLDLTLQSTLTFNVTHLIRLHPFFHRNCFYSHSPPPCLPFIVSNDLLSPICNAAFILLCRHTVCCTQTVTDRLFLIFVVSELTSAPTYLTLPSNMSPLFTPITPAFPFFLPVSLTVPISRPRNQLYLFIASYLNPVSTFSHPPATTAVSTTFVPVSPFRRPASPAPLSNNAFRCSPLSAPSRNASPSMLIPPGNVPTRLPHLLQTFLIINVVPFLWGSYAPVVKILTQLDFPMPLTLTNLLTTASGAIVLSFIRQQQTPQSTNAKPSFISSAELGGYIFIGAWLHLRSIALTTASRSAFFIQLTTVFVPLLELFAGKKVPFSVFPACLLTLVGAFFLVLPSDPDISTNAVSTIFASFNPGDIVSILSALCYRFVSPFFFFFVQCVSCLFFFFFAILI